MASTFASGTFTGSTSQVGPFGNLGHRAHGRLSITTGDLKNNPGRPAVIITASYETRCRIDPSPMGFYSNRPIPKIFMVHGDRFRGDFRYSEQTEDVNNGAKVAGDISGSVSGLFKSTRLITGQVTLIVRVFEHDRQQNTCTANFTYSARRR